MARKAEGENELRSRIATDPRKKATYGAAWERIAEAQKTAARLVKPFNFLERGFAFDSDLFRIARHPGSPCRGEAQAQLGSAQGVSRLRPAVARASALFRGAHLPRVRGGQARPCAGLLEEEHARSSADRARLAGPLCPRRPPAILSATPSWPISRCGRSWPRVARPRSRSATTR